MNYTRVLTAVAIMAVVTYIPRMLPLVLLKRKIQNRFVRSFLQYVPYAVLAAMTFPGILFSTATVLSAAFGLLAALALAYWGRSLLTVALGSTAAVLLAEWVISLIH